MVPLLDSGDDVGMVLSPQLFYNVNLKADIFNHANTHFWNYMQVCVFVWVWGCVVGCESEQLYTSHTNFIQ